MFVLYRELESVAQYRKALEESDSKVLRLEQELKISKGQALLARQEQMSAARSVDEMAFLRRDLASKTTKLEELEKSHQNLVAELEDLKKVSESKDEEMKNWRGRLKMMLGE